MSTSSGTSGSRSGNQNEPQSQQQQQQQQQQQDKSDKRQKGKKASGGSQEKESGDGTSEEFRKLDIGVEHPAGDIIDIPYAPALQLMLSRQTKTLDLQAEIQSRLVVLDLSERLDQLDTEYARSIYGLLKSCDHKIYDAIVKPGVFDGMFPVGEVELRATPFDYQLTSAQLMSSVIARGENQRRALIGDALDRLRMLKGVAGHFGIKRQIIDVAIYEVQEKLDTLESDQTAHHKREIIVQSHQQIAQRTIAPQHPRQVEQQIGQPSSSRQWPIVDVMDAKDRIEVFAQLPGCSKDAVSTRISDDGKLLVISGSCGQLVESKSKECKGKFGKRESKSGKFERGIDLGCTVDPRDVNAQMEDGVLMVSLKKKSQ